MIMRIKKVIKVFFFILGGIAALIIIGGFIADTWQRCHGNWQKYRAIAWIFNEYNLELPGWAWIGILIITPVLSTFIFWLIIRQPRNDTFIDETDIKIELNDWWASRKSAHQSKPRWMGSPSLEFVVDYCHIDKHRNLQKGSAAKFLPQTIEGDPSYEIKSK